MSFKRNRNRDLESRLRNERPRPDAELVDTIVASVSRTSAVARPRSLRIAFAVASVGILAALAALGGVSYAASGVTHAATAVKHVFVSDKAEQARQNTAFDVLSSLTPASTSAGDQYLPPGTTPSQAVTNFESYVVNADKTLNNTIDCSKLAGAAKAACLKKKKELADLQAALSTRLNVAVGKINSLTGPKLNTVATLLAIHLQQEQKLADLQAARRASCKSTTFKKAHPATCAKANPTVEAAERLKLGQLELAELEGLLGALGA